jgi:hypothetical protein
MATNEKNSAPKTGRDISHRGTWFRIPDRAMWHSEAHREYGVIWSKCGMRVLAAETEARKELSEEDTPCARCAG